MAPCSSSRRAATMFAALVCFAALAIQPSIAQANNGPPSLPASGIDPLPFAMFSYLSNALLYGVGRTLQADAPATLGDLFKVTQGALADNIRRAQKSINAYNQQLQVDLAKGLDPSQDGKVRASASDDGTAAINSLCAIYTRYAAAPLVNADATPSPTLNNLIRGACASATADRPGSTRSSSSSSLASLPLADAIRTFNAGVDFSGPAAPPAARSTGASAAAPVATRAVGSGSGSVAGGDVQLGSGQFVRAITKLASNVGAAIESSSATANKATRTAGSN